MACSYKIGDTWYSEEEIDLIYRNSKGEDVTEAWDKLQETKVEQPTTIETKEVQEPTKKELPNVEVGNITKDVVKPAQILLPFKFQDNSGKKLDYNDFKNPDGTLNVSKIDPKLLEGLGMRIPNQGPNSQSFIEIVGFLPSYMGDVAIASQDYLAQMGSDFDVDALYTYMYAHVMYNGKLQEITEDLKKEILKDYDINSEEELTQFTNDLKSENLQSILKEYKEATKKANDEAITTRENEEYFNISREASNKIFEEVAKYKELADIVKGDMDTLLLFDKVFNKTDNSTLKNKILDTHIAIHSNPSQAVQSQIKRPLGFWKLPTLIEQLEEGQTKEAVVPISDQYQTDKFKGGTSGKAGTGVFSNVSTFNAIIQGLDLTYMTKTPKGLKPWSMQLGNRISKGKLGLEKALDGKTYISEIIEGYQSAAVDNANENILDKLNITSDTFKAIQAGHLLGFTDEIPYILVQDIVKEYVEEVTKLNGLGKVNANAETEAYINIREKHLADVSNTKMAEKSELKRRWATLTPEFLLDTKKVGPEMVDYHITQLSVLEAFIELDTIGKELAKVQGLINTDSAMLGKNLFETTSKEDRLRSTIRKSPIKNLSKVLTGTINGFATEYGLVLNNKLWSNIVPYTQFGLTNFFEQAEVAFGKTEDSASSIANFRVRMWDTVKSYIYTDPNLGLYSDNITNERERLFFDRPNKESLASYVKRLKTNIPANAFLQSLDAKIEPSGSKPSLLMNNSAINFNENQDLVFAGFTNLILSNQKLEDFNGEPYTTRNLAEDIVLASMISGGVQDAKNYVKLIPPAYLYNLTQPGGNETFIEKLSKITRDKLLNDNSYMELSAQDPNFFPEVLEQIIKHNGSILPKKVENNLRPVGGGLVQVDSTIPFFSVRNKSKSYDIYKLKKQVDKGGVYEKLDSKGNADYSEYTFNETQVSSIAGNVPKGFNPNIQNNETHITEQGNSVALKNPNYKKADPAIELGLEPGGSITETLSTIANNPDTSFSTELASYYKGKKEALDKLTVQYKPVYVNGIPAQGSYMNNTIEINTSEYMYEQMGKSFDKDTLTEVVLHELTHHFTVDAWKNPKTIDQKKAKINLTELFNKFKAEELDNNVFGNAKSSELEFIAELMSNPKVQSKVDNLLFNESKTFLDRFKEIVRTLLGVNYKGKTLQLAVNDVITLIEGVELNNESEGNPNGEVDNGGLEQFFKPFSIQAYFPAKEDILTKYNISDNGISKGLSYPDAMKKAREINKDQGVYEAKVSKAYRLVKGQRKEMSIVSLLWSDKMNDINYAVTQLSPEMKKQIRKNTCK